MAEKKVYLEHASRAFGIDSSTLESLTDGNSQADVFKGESSSGPRVLKISRANSIAFLGGKESMLEGLLYQEGLAERMVGDVAYAGPLRSQNGKLGEELETGDGTGIAVAFGLAPGKEIKRQDVGYQVAIHDPGVAGPLFERIGRALGTMHRYSSEYAVWWPSVAADLPDTPFTGRKDRDGASLVTAPVYAGDSFINAAVADEPELADHWESIQAQRRSWIPGRSEYGYLHFDFALGNMLYTPERLTIIDHLAIFGWFFDEIGHPFTRLKNDGFPDRLVQIFWRRFATGYNREFSINAEWLTRLSTSLDSRRLFFYAMNMARKKRGLEVPDIAVIGKWREDMTNGVPWVAIDFSLP